MCHKYKKTPLALVGEEEFVQVVLGVSFGPVGYFFRAVSTGVASKWSVNFSSSDLCAWLPVLCVMVEPMKLS